MSLCIAVVAFFVISASAVNSATTTLALLQAGQYDAARANLEKEVVGHPDAAQLRALLEAMILRQKGKTDQAISMLQTLVRDNPDFVPARRTLASTLARTGQADRALYHAQQLLRQSTNKSLREETQAYIDQNAGPERGVSLRFSLKPSSNITNGSDNPQVLNGFAHASPESGLSLSVGATAWQRWRLTEFWSTTLSGRIDGAFHSHAKLDHEITTGVSLGFGRNWQRGYINIAPTFERSALGGAYHRKRFGVQIRGAWRQAPKRQFNARIAHWRQIHPTSRDHFDGHRTNGELGFSYLLSRRSKLSLAVPFEIERTQRSNLAYNEVGLEVSWDKSWKNGLTTGLTLGVSNTHYLDTYTNAQISRDDTRKTIGLSLRHRGVRFGKFMPELRYLFTDVTSNIASRAYKKHDISIGVVRSF